VIGTLVTPPLARRIPPAHLMSWGLVLSSIGYVLIARLGTSADDLPSFAVANFIMSLGASPLFTLTNDISIGSAPPERAGAASGISETCAEFGGALGIAVFGSIGVVIYRSMLAAALPAGLPADVVAETTATLGGAVASASRLPADLRAVVVDGARDAFTRGLQVCSVISAAGTLALAVLAAKTFRQRTAVASAP